MSHVTELTFLRDLGLFLPRNHRALTDYHPCPKAVKYLHSAFPPHSVVLTLAKSEECILGIPQVSDRAVACLIIDLNERNSLSLVPRREGVKSERASS